MDKTTEGRKRRAAWQKAYVIQGLEACDYKILKTADYLGFTKRWLENKLIEFGMIEFICEKNQRSKDVRDAHSAKEKREPGWLFRV